MAVGDATLGETVAAVLVWVFDIIRRRQPILKFSNARLWADTTCIDLRTPGVGGVEMIDAEDLQASQQGVDLELGDHDGVKG